MKGRLWILAVPALLLPVVVMNVVMLIKSTGSSAVAVEPDYYEKAIHWDERVELEAASRALGWQLELELQPGEDAPRLQAVLRDSSKSLVIDAEVEVEAFHNALSDRRKTLRLAFDDSLYHADFPGNRPGLWEFRLQARRGEELFTATRRLDLGPVLVGRN